MIDNHVWCVTDHFSKTKTTRVISKRNVFFSGTISVLGNSWETWVVDYAAWENRGNYSLLH